MSVSAPPITLDGGWTDLYVASGIEAGSSLLVYVDGGSAAFAKTEGAEPANLSFDSEAAANHQAFLGGRPNLTLWARATSAGAATIRVQQDSEDASRLSSAPLGRPTGLDISRRAIPDFAKVNKFGANAAVGTSFEAVTVDGLYRMPQPAGAQQLRVRAGDAADAAAGAGARSVLLQGIDATGQFISEDVFTNGASAGTLSNLSFMRLFRAYVDGSGTYADGTPAAQSQEAEVIIEDAAGNTWATIGTAGSFGVGSSLIGAYTVPLGYHAMIPEILVTVDGNKAIDFLLMQRRGALDTSPPYAALRTVEQFRGVTQSLAIPLTVALGPFPESTDIVCFAKTSSGTAAVSVSFDIILILGDPPPRQITPDEG